MLNIRHNNKIAIDVLQGHRHIVLTFPVPSRSVVKYQSRFERSSKVEILCTCFSTGSCPPQGKTFVRSAVGFACLKWSKSNSVMMFSLTANKLWKSFLLTNPEADEYRDRLLHVAMEFSILIVALRQTTILRVHTGSSSHHQLLHLGIILSVK